MPGALVVGGTDVADRWHTMSLSTLKKENPHIRAPRTGPKKTPKDGLVVGGRDQHDWGTMSLSTIKSRNKARNRLFRSPKQTNMTSDIPGASVPKAYKFTNKPDYGCRVDDIPGARPMKLEKTSNAISRITDCSDIPGAQPSPHTFKTNRTSDPLCPSYKLPVVEPEPVPPKKFLGDRMGVADIGGARPAPLYKFAQRESMGVTDIEGASAGWKPAHKRHLGPPRDNINVLDIIGGNFKSKRVTNPLNPVHVIFGQRIVDDPRSRPRKLPKKRNGPNLMNTRDIPGAYPGWQPPNKREIRQVRPTNATADIRGAQADSFQHGIRTKRRSNPLDPFYTGVDGTRLGSVKKPNTPDASQSTFFRSLDADGDGVVTAQELIANIDQDGDGEISQQEMHDAMNKSSSSAGRALLSKLQYIGDRDGDGKISANEIDNTIPQAVMPVDGRNMAANQPKPVVKNLDLRAMTGQQAKPETEDYNDEIERLQARIASLRASGQKQSLVRASARSSARRRQQASARSTARRKSRRSSERSSARRSSRSSSSQQRPMTQSQKREAAQLAADMAMVASLPESPLANAGKEALRA